MRRAFLASQPAPDFTPLLTPSGGNTPCLLFTLFPLGDTRCTRRRHAKNDTATPASPLLFYMIERDDIDYF